MPLVHQKYPQSIDYLNAHNVILSNGVTHANDGSIIPKGVTSFTASVPVIDDTLIENTEQAILSIGSHSGVGQIFDNDSLPNSKPNSRPRPLISAIEANTATEGAHEDLIYRVSFDRPHLSSLHYQFNVGGDASFGLDYLTGKNVVITNGVINNHDGSITVPKGVHTFKAHVPVVDDSIIETTEIASIQIGRHQGIGQIIDNDSQSIPDTNDIYLLLDTSTSMLRTGGKNRRKLQSLLALNTFSQDVERAGYQFQNAAIAPSFQQQSCSKGWPKNQKSRYQRPEQLHPHR